MTWKTIMECVFLMQEAAAKLDKLVDPGEGKKDALVEALRFRAQQLNARAAGRDKAMWELNKALQAIERQVEGP